MSAAKGGVQVNSANLPVLWQHTMRVLAREKVGEAVDAIVWWLSHSVHGCQGGYPLVLGWQIWWDSAERHIECAEIILAARDALRREVDAAMLADCTRDLREAEAQAPDVGVHRG